MKKPNKSDLNTSGAKCDDLHKSLNTIATSHQKSKETKMNTEYYKADTEEAKRN